MISDVLLVVGLGALAAAGFLISIFAGLVSLGVALLVLAFCLADGKG